MFKAPFPWFGGKSRSVGEIWPRLGQVRNYVEPFFGSGALLFNRPAESFHTTRQNIETICDIDCYVSNFWRAVQAEPDMVAHWADWPVCEADLHARHDWLVFSEDIIQWRKRMHHDPDYYDVKIAGYWVWGLCQWIGGGWCTDYGATKAGKARKQTIPDLMSAGKGVNRPEQDSEPLTQHRIPHMGDSGRGVHRPEQNTPACPLTRLLDRVRQGVDDETRTRILAKLLTNTTPLAMEIKSELDGKTLQKIPHLHNAGKGVHHPEQTTPAKIPQLGRHQGVHRFEFGEQTPGTRADLYTYMASIQDRLRGVRIVCGDWSRVVKSSVTTFHGQTAVLLDPPYSSDRHNDRDIFAKDDINIAHAVRAWCIENGNNTLYRICLTGHGHEHTLLELYGWTPVKLKGVSGYNHSNPDSEATKLAKSETAWFSPHCVKTPADVAYWESRYAFGMVG